MKFFKPVYSTEAQVLIENLSSPYDRTQTPDDPRPDPVDDRVIKSQMSVLKSQDLALRVVEDLNLQERPEFDSLKQKGARQNQAAPPGLRIWRRPAAANAAAAGAETRDGRTHGLSDTRIECGCHKIFRLSSGKRRPRWPTRWSTSMSPQRRKPTRSQRPGRGTGLPGKSRICERKWQAPMPAIEEFRSQAGLLQGETQPSEPRNFPNSIRR